ncbi:hypothetical protein [Rhodococcus sp. IEGM 1307]|uniref:hypothetical protein n=1 Tax=Rhodococcus sp. IEGM 1307 TaxID=3047091 RepID=UPI0024B6A875|nr:hypothetical protein [Rhodococcus sp. IEGM 1307]MDI9978801.1 hypothetical protein [Rhodococcus sp. IEGM 1307]
MSTRVATLHRRYRIHGTALDPVGVRRLDRLAAERISEGLEPALAAFDAEETVYVVRRVHARTTVNLATPSDPALAHRWCRDLGRSVARTIIDDSGDGTNVVRFASDADFVAAFVSDMIAGKAWQRWYFGAFVHHRGESPRTAIEAVLVEYRDRLAAILAALVRRRMLEPMLALIDTKVLALHPASESLAEPDAEGWRPLVAAATHIAGVLDLWIAAAPAPEAVLRQWASTGREQPDWRDAAALTDAVMAIIAWFARTGAAHTPDSQDLLRLDTAEAGLDWLDLPRLRSALAAQWRDQTDAAHLPRRSATATPRQRDLLAALARAIDDQRPTLDASTPTAGANAARMLAALAASEPAWADDPLAQVIIEKMLAVWAQVIAAREPQRLLRAVAAADLVGAIAAWEGTGLTDTAPENLRQCEPAVSETLARATQWCEPAADVLAAMGGDAAAGSGDTFVSPVAGVLLLQRVLLDVRLAGLAERHDYPAAGPEYLLAVVGLCWAGALGSVDDRIDPAVRLLAGGTGPRTVDELTAAWRGIGSTGHNAWRTAIDDLLALHGLSPTVAADDPLDHTAQALLRIWVRWLRGFENSSIPFILEQFVRRPGTVTAASDRVTVRLPRRPLDTVLEISGYLRPIESLPGLLARRIEFQVGDLQ